MTHDSIIIDGRLYNYTVYDNNINIVDSQFVRKQYFKSTLEWINEKHPKTEVWKRSYKSMCREWACHNFLWSYGIARERVRNIDLNYPQKWYISALYWVGGFIVWPFVN